MIIENCDKCGGTHIGSYECPFETIPTVEPLPAVEQPKTEPTTFDSSSELPMGGKKFDDWEGYRS